MLTDRAISLAKPAEKDRFIHDGNGLYLRVRTTGAKGFVYRYKAKGKTHWVTLGAYKEKKKNHAQVGDPKALSVTPEALDERLLSLVDARLKAAALAHQRKRGLDPVSERKRADDKKAAIEAAHAARLTVGQLFERWVASDISRHRDGGAEVKRRLNKDLIPTLGNVPAADVTRAMIANILDAVVVDRKAPIIARKLLSDIRQMYGFGITRGIVENDPTSRIRRDDFGKNVLRERVLSESEVRDLAEKLLGSGCQRATELALWIMLSTCCRIGEITKAKWEHLDLEARTWRIPPDNAKNSKEHIVSLSDFALRQFSELRKLRAHGVWCFPASQRNSKQKKDAAREHVCTKSITRQVYDRQRTKAMSHRTGATGTLCLAQGRWTPHDLRRTAATLMGTLGVRPDVIEKCLNHVEQNPMIRTYQRQTLEPEKREAWRLLGDRLELILRSDSHNVIAANFAKAA